MAKRILHFLDRYSVYILGITIIFVFFWIIGTFSYTTTVEEDADQAVRDFNDNWCYSYENQTGTIAEMPAKLSVKRGTSFTIENTLPKDVKDGMTLAFSITRQTGTVYINDSPVFELNNTSGELFEHFPISKVQYIPLKSEYAGQKIKIELVSYSFEFSGRINEMYYGEYGACVKTNFIFQAPIAALYLFILFVGIILCVIFLFIKGEKKKYMEILLLGMTTVNLALSVITGYNIFQSYLSSDAQISMLGLISKLSLPFVYLIYYSVVVQAKRTRKAARYFMILFLVFCIAVLLFPIIGTADLGVCMTFYSVSTIIMFAVSIIFIIIEICLEYLYSEIPLFLALHIFMFTIIVEGFSYFQNVMSYRSFGVFLGAGVICSLIIMGAFLTNNIIHTFDENRRINEELIKNRVDLMINQIQPHFVYNTLNSIQSLIEVDAKKASEMIYNFSKYLRTHVDTMEMEGLVTFEEELDSIKTYVDIELVRFPKIKVIYDIREKNFFLPMLSIQPIVENAIRHGLAKKMTGGTVEIKSYQTQSAYVIEINDDGVGFPVKNGADNLNGEVTYSVGVKNITYRLNKLINATIQCKSKPGEGTSFIIEIPKRGEIYDENNFS